MISNIVRDFIWLLPVIFLVLVVVFMIDRRKPRWIGPPTPTDEATVGARERDNHGA